MSKYKTVKAGSKHGSYNAVSAENIITGAWTALLLTLFPIIIDMVGHYDSKKKYIVRYYFNILETKFNTYCILTGTLLACLLVWGFMSGRIFSYLDKSGTFIRENGFWAWFKKTFDFPDRCVLLFFLISVIATLTAGISIPKLVITNTTTLATPQNFLEWAFTGIEGRRNGLELLCFYVLAYFCVSRFFKFKKRYVTLFLYAGLFVCLFGISDYFKRQFLWVNLKATMKNSQISMFTSTIGNINTYTTVVGFSIALAGTLFVLSREVLPKIAFYAVCLVIAFEAMAMGNSDNGYLVLAAFFGFLPFFAFRSRQGIRRYFVTIALFFTDLIFVKHINTVNAGKVLGINGLFNVLTNWKYLTVLTAALWGIAIVLYVLDFVTRADKAPAPKWVLILWYVFFGAAAVTIIYLVAKANSMTMDEATKKFGGLASYLKYSDSWGTNRGAVWNEAIRDYEKLPVIHQIFGTGPDTFGVYMQAMSHDVLVQKTGQIYDSAHNEYLQFLFTVGPIGLIAYIGFLAGSVRTALRKAAIITGFKVPSENDHYDVSDMEEENAPFITAFAMLILCYAVQAFVNINLPISTPILWTFIMIAAAMGRKRAL